MARSSASKLPLRRHFFRSDKFKSPGFRPGLRVANSVEKSSEVNLRFGDEKTIGERVLLRVGLQDRSSTSWPVESAECLLHRASGGG